MSPADLLLPTYSQMLRALSAWLTKAAEQKPESEAEALLSAELAPDMFPLSTQIRFACVQVYEGVYRLKEADFPPLVDTLLDEGRNAREHPGSISDAQGRIGDALAMLENLDPAALGAQPQQPLAHSLPNGMIFDLTVEQYARDWTVPQFFFHIMTAYAILRSQGVELGKADYVTHMFPYLRQQGEPAA